MSVELYRRARRAEATAERAEDRRRLRLEFFRQALTQGLDSLKVRHAEGASGKESVHAHAHLMDDVIFSLTRLIADDTARARLDATPLVVVALGGYGRRELHPLVRHRPHGGVRRRALAVRPADDAGAALLPVGPRLAGRPQPALAGRLRGHGAHRLSEPHVDAGGAIPRRRPAALRPVRPRAARERLPARLRPVPRDDAGRARSAVPASFGASPYIGEPNVKESAGGLRDVHTAMWLGEAKFGARTLRELADKGLITSREQAATDAALTFLWRVRNELHFFSGHKNDVLGRDVQPRIAKNLGYENDDTSLGVERFMRDYYLHARAIHRVSRRLIARCQETLSRRGSAEAPAAPAGAGRRARVLRRTAPSRRPRPRTAPRRAVAAHEGLLASASPGLRAVARPRARRRGFALPRRRRRFSGRRPCATCSSTSAGRGDGRPRRSRRCTSSGCWDGTCRSSAR